MQAPLASEEDAFARIHALGHRQKVLCSCFEDAESNRDMRIELQEENCFGYDESRLRSQVRQVFLWYRYPASKMLT